MENVTVILTDLFQMIAELIERKENQQEEEIKKQLTSELAKIVPKLTRAIELDRLKNEQVRTTKIVR